jgi:hypothetical protein
MENVNLDLFLMQMGIVPKKSELEEMEDVVDLRHLHMSKGWFNDPRDKGRKPVSLLENGDWRFVDEVPF